MRRPLAVLALVCLCSVAAAAQGKISSTWTCDKQDPNLMKSLEVGDQPNHSYVIYQFKCMAKTGEIAGVKEKDGAGTEFADASGSASSGHGVFVENLANGDKLRISYTAKSMMKGSDFAAGSNKFDIAGLTGKAKGIKGSGSCTGKGNADGTSSWTCTGTYSSAK